MPAWRAIPAVPAWCAVPAADVPARRAVRAAGTSVPRAVRADLPAAADGDRAGREGPADQVGGPAPPCPGSGGAPVGPGAYVVPVAVGRRRHLVRPGGRPRCSTTPPRLSSLPRRRDRTETSSVRDEEPVRRRCPGPAPRRCRDAAAGPALEWRLVGVAPRVNWLHSARLGGWVAVTRANRVNCARRSRPRPSPWETWALLRRGRPRWARKVREAQRPSRRPGPLQDERPRRRADRRVETRRRAARRAARGWARPAWAPGHADAEAGPATKRQAADARPAADERQVDERQADERPADEWTGGVPAPARGPAAAPVPHGAAGPAPVRPVGTCRRRRSGSAAAARPAVCRGGRAARAPALPVPPAPRTAPRRGQVARGCWTCPGRRRGRRPRPPPVPLKRSSPDASSYLRTTQ